MWLAFVLRYLTRNKFSLVQNRTNRTENFVRCGAQEFKQQVLKKSRECCIKLGSLSMATVRVPTRADANAVFWEFATDHYDLAFGVQFEWLLEPPESITVQHHDPEDEEDDDAPANEGQPAPPADGATSGSSNNANPGIC